MLFTGLSLLLKTQSDNLEASQAGQVQELALAVGYQYQTRLQMSSCCDRRLAASACRACSGYDVIDKHRRSSIHIMSAPFCSSSFLCVLSHRFSWVTCTKTLMCTHLSLLCDSTLSHQKHRREKSLLEVALAFSRVTALEGSPI